MHETSGAVMAGVPPAKEKTAAASGASPVSGIFDRR
jgi:hypothetical protein